MAAERPGYGPGHRSPRNHPRIWLGGILISFLAKHGSSMRQPALEKTLHGYLDRPTITDDLWWAIVDKTCSMSSLHSWASTRRPDHKP
eukprot:11274813-Prorocentrum_lima.AAC.1